MKTTSSAVLASLSIVLSLTASADEAFENAIRQCRAIENPDARLTCYDAVASVAPPAAAEAPTGLSEGGSASEAAPVAPTGLATGTAAATAASVPEAPSVDGTSSATMSADGGAYDAPAPEPAVQPLTDDVGMERVDPTAERENPEYSARVVSCQRSQQSGQTYFVLDNDQVWKQANYRRMSLGDCDFEIRLSKDAFGYELYIPSKDRTVRVTRIR